MNLGNLIHGLSGIDSVFSCTVKLSMIIFQKNTGAANEDIGELLLSWCLQRSINGIPLQPMDIVEGFSLF